MEATLRHLRERRLDVSHCCEYSRKEEGTSFRILCSEMFKRHMSVTVGSWMLVTDWVMG